MANPHPSVKGRKRGVPNKFSAQRVEVLARQGRKRPDQELVDLYYYCRGQAARFQSDIVEHGKWIDRAREAARDAAPYSASKLAGIVIQGNLQELEHADPRQVMWEIYKQMRERGELGLKALAPPLVKANGGESRPESVEQPMREDDGDGVAA